MGSNDAVMERFRAALNSGDIKQLSAALIDSVSDDFVQEWPQSGERIVGRDAVIKLNEGYEGATGTSPKMTLRRILGSGDTYVAEATIDYGDGTPVSYVGIAEFRDGKIAKMTEYFANPFEAPAWRAGLVQRMEPAGV
jgi:ketosteroid isomerase-like protein